ncbi:hypothetical protein DPMN_140939 [Dreissena polymorpha]|uniref:Uncharacterized protein n=1 Tax=Dreissena polymorpha TaxID=45954 RepID=A0A9D4GBD2_DREPO|nr:hypothetical protein DPMN_140939 [Dreissena polymorpha]
MFLEKIIQENLQDNNIFIYIGCRPISNLRFAEDIDLMGGTSSKLKDLTNKL